RSQYLARTRHVEIWLPPDYDAYPDRRFPVIYMHDGQNLFDPRIANTGSDWGVDETMMRLLSSGAIATPAIVVGVWNSDLRRVEYAPNRILDAVGPEVKARDAPEFRTDLLGDQYVRFLVEELKPRVDAAYRTRPDRDNTLIMGSSMGALISFYAMTEAPNVFGGAGCLSMHWPVGVDFDRIFTHADDW